MASDNQQATSGGRTRGPWYRLSSNLCVVTVLHPFYYGRTLMQLGYEPWPPEPGHNVFGQSILRIPNVIQYVGHIGSTQGFGGCFHGLLPSLLETVVMFVAYERMNEQLGPPPTTLENKAENEITHAELDTHFQLLLMRDLKLCVCGIVVGHPLHVITLRMMAQFMAREPEFSGMFGTIVDICRHDGIFGFFGGLVPRLIYEVSFLVISRYAVLQLRKYVTKDRFTRTLSEFSVSCIVERLFYPFRLVSTCMAVNSASNSLSKYPVLPFYSSSVDCWMDLQARRELHRGHGLFFRKLNEAEIKARRKGKMPSLFGTG